MNNRHLPFCPYCNKKLRYFESWFLHRYGEYTCPKCGYNSKITYTRNIKTFLIFCIALAAFLAFTFAILGKVNLIQVILVSVPFLVFYILVPFFMVLKTTQQNSYLKNIFDEDDDLEIQNEDQEEISMEHTNVLSSSKVKADSAEQKRKFNDIDKTRIIP